MSIEWSPDTHLNYSKSPTPLLSFCPTIKSNIYHYFFIKFFFTFIYSYNLDKKQILILKLFLLSDGSSSLPLKYITILAHNKAGRTARIIPKPKGRHSGYLIPANSYLKVNIVVRGRRQAIPINFGAEDEDTQTKFLLNNRDYPIAVTPSEDSGLITNMTITARGES